CEPVIWTRWTAARPAGFQKAASTPSPIDTNAPPTPEARAPAGIARNAKAEGSACAGGCARARNSSAAAERRQIIVVSFTRTRDGAGVPGPVAWDFGRRF